MRVKIKLPPDSRIRVLPPHGRQWEAGEEFPNEIEFDIEPKEYETFVPLVTLTVAADSQTLTEALHYWVPKRRIVNGR